MRVAFVCFVLLFAGCTITRTNNVTSGLFDDDPEVLLEKYKLIIPYQTSVSGLKEIGFDLNAPNVKQVPGAEAIKLIFGSNVFQGAVDSPEDIDKLLAELNQYNLIIFPHKDVAQYEDRFYFSRKETHEKGITVNIFIVLKNNQVVYCAKDIEKIDRHQAEKAFAEGVLKLLGKLSDGRDAVDIKKD